MQKNLEFDDRNRWKICAAVYVIASIAATMMVVPLLLRSVNMYSNGDRFVSTPGNCGGSCNCFEFRTGRRFQQWRQWRHCFFEFRVAVMTPVPAMAAMAVLASVVTSSKKDAGSSNGGNGGRFGSMYFR